MEERCGGEGNKLNILKKVQDTGKRYETVDWENEFSEERRGPVTSDD